MTTYWPVVIAVVNAEIQFYASLPSPLTSRTSGRFVRNDVAVAMAYHLGFVESLGVGSPLLVTFLVFARLVADRPKRIIDDAQILPIPSSSCNALPGRASVRRQFDHLVYPITRPDLQKR